MYLTGILAAFISPMTHSLANIFDAYITGHLFKKVSTAIFYANITNILGPVVLLLIGPVHWLPASVWPYAIVIGLINVVYLFPYYMALRTVDTSIVAALFSLEKIFIPFWAYFIVHEVVQPSQYLGLGIIIIASIILNVQNPKKIKLNQGFWLMLFTAVILSFEDTFYKRILLETDWISAAFWSAMLTFIIRWGILFSKSARLEIIKDFPIYKANFPKFCFIEIFDQLGNLGPVFALSLIPVLVQTSISSTQPIFVMFYGWLLTKLFKHQFKENLSLSQTIKKLICFIIIGLGVSLAIGW